MISSSQYPLSLVTGNWFAIPYCWCGPTLRVKLVPWIYLHVRSVYSLIILSLVTGNDFCHSILFMYWFVVNQFLEFVCILGLFIVEFNLSDLQSCLRSTPCGRGTVASIVYCRCTYWCPEINSWENSLMIIHYSVLWHFAMSTSVNCHTCILGMMLNCIRTEWNYIE